MPTAGRAPAYLYQRTNLFYFRVAVPTDLRKRLGRTNVRLALGTARLSEARPLARRLSDAAYNFFKLLRIDPAMKELTADESARLLLEFLRSELDEDIKLRMAPPLKPPKKHYPLTVDTVFERGAMETADEFAFYDQHGKWKGPGRSGYRSIVRGYARRAIPKADVRLVKDEVEAFLVDKGIEVDAGSTAFQTLCFRVLEQLPELLNCLNRRERGEAVSVEKCFPDLIVQSPDQSVLHPQPLAPSEPNGSVAPLQSQPAQTTFPPASTDKAYMPVSKAIDEFITDKINTEEWKPRSANEGKKLYQFAEIIGNPPCWHLNVDHVETYKGAVFRLPANLNKKKEYRDRPILDVLKMNVPKDKRIKPDTIKNYFEKVRTFINWLKTRQRIPDADITRILTVKITKQPEENRAPFSDKDISKLFAAETFLLKRAAKPWKFWVPVIGLFTGMRIEEVCQLYLDDIREEDGHMCFWVTDERPDQELKGPPSKRYIPLHPFLLDDLNFLGFVKKLREAGEQRLFPDLTKKDQYDRYSAYPSRWFGDYRNRKACVLGSEKGKKDFHSFRTNIGLWCEEHEVQEKLAARVLGHKWPNITYGRYSRDASPSRMYDSVFSKLDYGVDLSHLRNSEFVVK